MDENAQKDAVLAALLPNVPFDGWTFDALRAAAKSAGIGDAELALLYPRGPRDAVAWFSHWADRLMLETVASRPIDGIGRGAAVSLAVRTRLTLLAPHREAVRRALSLLALPQNTGLGLKLLYDTVDAVWYAAGDSSTDFSFYTKRATLAGLYAATTLYWLDDRSEDGSATDAFLERRIAGIAFLPRIRGQIGRFAEMLPNPVRFLRAARQLL
jgi:ubiquinone biosynthesis protein COQ9